MFRKIVQERGETLRALAYEKLPSAGKRPPEVLKVEGLSATIGTIVQLVPDGSLRVVVNGSMDCKFKLFKFMGCRNVDNDGFYKYPDGSVKPMRDFKEFD